MQWLFSGTSIIIIVFLFVNSMSHFKGMLHSMWQLLHCTVVIESRLLVKQNFLGSCLGYPDLRSLNKLLFSAWVAVSVQRKHPLKVLLPLMLSSRALLYGGQACLDCFSLFSIFTAVMRVIAWYPEYNLFFHDTLVTQKSETWLINLFVDCVPA